MYQISQSADKAGDDNIVASKNGLMNRNEFGSILLLLLLISSGLWTGLACAPRGQTYRYHSHRSGYDSPYSHRYNHRYHNGHHHHYSNDYHDDEHEDDDEDDDGSDDNNRSDLEKRLKKRK